MLISRCVIKKINTSSCDTVGPVPLAPWGRCVYACVQIQPSGLGIFSIMRKLGEERAGRRGLSPDWSSWHRRLWLRTLETAWDSKCDVLTITKCCRFVTEGQGRALQERRSGRPLKNCFFFLFNSGL